MKSEQLPIRHIQYSESELERFCRDNLISELSLFGSVLTTDYAEDRDLDVLVRFDSGATVSFLTLAAVQRELSQIFGRRVDLVLKAGLKPNIREQILADAVKIYAN